MAQQSLTPRQARKSCESRVPPFIVPYYLEGKTCKDCLDESSWDLMHSVLWGAYVWWNTLRRFVIKSDDVWWYLNILGHLYIVFIYIHIHDHKAIRYVMILYVDIVILWTFCTVLDCTFWYLCLHWFGIFYFVTGTWSEYVNDLAKARSLNLQLWSGWKLCFWFCMDVGLFSKW